MSEPALTGRPDGSRRELRRLAHQSAVSTTYANRDRSQDETDAQRATAAREGYEAGYADGLARATEDANLVREEESRRAAVAMAALTRAVHTVQEVEQQLRADLQAAAPQLAFALLEELLARELALAVNPGLDAITRVLALDEGTSPARVRMNPADVETLGELGLSRETVVVPDPGIQPGSAVAEIGRTTLDGQLEAALLRVRQILLGPDVTGASGDRAA